MTLNAVMIACILNYSVLDWIYVNWIASDSIHEIGYELVFATELSIAIKKQKWSAQELSMLKSEIEDTVVKLLCVYEALMNIIRLSYNFTLNILRSCLIDCMY